MKVVKNVSDEWMPNKYYPRIRQYRNDFSLDYLKSNDLGAIEEGIRETMEGINYANLAVALAFAKIDREALYVQAGCRSYLEYLDTAEDRLNMSRQTMSDYKRIGDIYLTYKAQLQQAGFREEGNLHKLRYLPRALERHPAEEVFSRIVKDSFRVFKKFAVPSERSDKGRIEEYNPQIEIAAKRIVIDGQNVLRFAPDLNEQIREELIGYLRSIYEIKAKGNTPYILDLYDGSETRAVEAFLKRLRMRG